MSCSNCKCGQEKVQTEWIETDYGSQLRFAVPKSGENEPMIDMVSEIEKEIVAYLNTQIETIESFESTKYEFALTKIACIKKIIETIFNNYRK